MQISEHKHLLKIKQPLTNVMHVPNSKTTRRCARPISNSNENVSQVLTGRIPGASLLSADTDSLVTPLCSERAESTTDEGLRYVRVTQVFLHVSFHSPREPVATNLTVQGEALNRTSETIKLHVLQTPSVPAWPATPASPKVFSKNTGALRCSRARPESFTVKKLRGKNLRLSGRLSFTLEY